MAQRNEEAPASEVIFTGLQYQGYCVKCKDKRDVTGDVTVSAKNGSKIAKGQCPVCRTVVCRILGKNWQAPE